MNVSYGARQPAADAKRTIIAELAKVIKEALKDDRILASDEALSL